MIAAQIPTVLECAVGLLFEHRLATVVGDVDEGGLKFHQGIQMVVYRADGLAFKRR